MNRTLYECLKQKENNVAAVKAIAAWLVIIGHAFAFSCNYERVDFMTQITKGAYNLGGFAVAVFFFFSGLFITKSLLSGKYSGIEFFKRRVVRIFPAFVLVTVAIVVIAGCFFSEYSFARYFADANTYRYFLNCIFVSVHNLPGVFMNNVYGSSVNGPIWTIKVEVICYIASYIAYKLRLLETRWGAFFMVPAILFLTAVPHISFVPTVFVTIARPVAMYILGMLCAVYMRKMPVGKKWVIIGGIAYLICIFLSLYELAIVLALPFILCGIAFDISSDNIVMKVLKSIGSVSYEIYLWGGFVGQAVVSLFGGFMSPYLNMVITIVVATVFGYITNKCLNFLGKKSRV